MRAQPPPPDGTAVSLRVTLDGAYRHILLPYHGWMTEEAVDLAVKTAPDWDDVRPHFAPSDHAFREDVAAFLPASQRLLRRINAARARLDLVDVRRSV